MVDDLNFQVTETQAVIKQIQEWGEAVNDTLADLEDKTKANRRLTTIVGACTAGTALGLMFVGRTVMKVITSLQELASAINQIPAQAVSQAQQAEQAQPSKEPVKVTEVLSDVSEPDDPGPQEPPAWAAQDLAKSNGDLKDVVRENIEP